MSTLKTKPSGKASSSKSSLSNPDHLLTVEEATAKLFEHAAPEIDYGNISILMEYAGFSPLRALNMLWTWWKNVVLTQPSVKKLLTTHLELFGLSFSFTNFLEMLGIMYVFAGKSGKDYKTANSSLKAALTWVVDTLGIANPDPNNTLDTLTWPRIASCLPHILVRYYHSGVVAPIAPSADLPKGMLFLGAPALFPTEAWEDHKDEWYVWLEEVRKTIATTAKRNKKASIKSLADMKNFAETTHKCQLYTPVIRADFFAKYFSNP